MMKRIRTIKPKLICCLLAAVLLCAAGYCLPVSAAAAAPTSLGFAEHGIQAFRDGWIYQGGAKGQTVSLSDGKTTRASDCAGLLYAYFSDLGVSGCKGGATSQVTSNCVMSNNISEGIPRIHGLAVTSPDFYDPGTGIYGHIGIYIGNNEEVDNSDYGVNMLWEKVVGGRAWNAWHVFDLGMKYPSNGWYAMDGKMYHYTDCEYDVNTAVNGYTIGSDGVAMQGGKEAPVDDSLLSDDYVSASVVVSTLKSKGYSGKDNTHDLIYGSSSDDPQYSARITGDGVRIREKATTKSAIVTTLSRNSRVRIVEEVEGENLTSDGITSKMWCSVVTSAGHSGYVWSPYVEENASSGKLTTPTIASEGGYVTFYTEAEQADIYYTTDCTEPTDSSIPYTGPVYMTGYTYKAVAYLNGQKSGTATASVLSDGSIFTDFTSEDWYFNAIDQAVSYGIFQGGGENKFSPAKNITRAQFVQALANLNGVDLTHYSADSGFEDVRATKWYARAVSWASETGLVKGYSDNSFRPEKIITREQMCQILANYGSLKPLEGSAKFADDSAISSWAKDAVYACRDHKLIQGVGDNRFSPQGTATRAQACIVTVNYYGL